jgi:hypothetical protein
MLFYCTADGHTQSHPEIRIQTNKIQIRFPFRILLMVKNKSSENILVNQTLCNYSCILRR